MTAAALGTFQVHHDSDIDYDCGLPETGKLWQLEQPELKSAGNLSQGGAARGAHHPAGTVTVTRGDVQAVRASWIIQPADPASWAGTG